MVSWFVQIEIVVVGKLFRIQVVRVELLEVHVALQKTVKISMDTYPSKDTNEKA